MTAASLAPSRFHIPRHLRLLLVAGILLLATFLRLTLTLDLPLSVDGAQITVKALQLIQDGQVTLQGPLMSVGLWHSPLTVYLYSLALLISPDPRLGMFFTGIMNVIAIAATYAVAARFFDWRAGLIAALFYAVHPEALLAGIGYWNLRLAGPFVMLFVLFLLLGYHEDYRWARIWHLPMLFFAGQCHPLLLAIGPVAPILWANAWWVRKPQRRQLITDTLLSGAVVLITLLPWIWGTLNGAVGGDVSFAPLGNRGWGYLFEGTYRMLANWEQVPWQFLHPLLVSVGTVWLLARGVFDRKAALPGVVVALVWLLEPLLALAFDVKWRDYHNWGAYGGAFVVQGALLGGVWAASKAKPAWARWRGLMDTPVLGWVGLAAVALLTWQHLNFLSYFDRAAGTPVVGDQMTALDTADKAAQQSNRALLLLAPIGQDLQYETFRRLTDTPDTYVLWPGRAMPLPASGAVMLSEAGSADWPPFVQDIHPVSNGFAQGVVPPALTPIVPLPAPVTFVRPDGGDVTVLGFWSSASPTAGDTWPLYMLWQMPTQPDDEFKLFVQLQNAAGDKYAQIDVAGLPVAQWRSGDMVVSAAPLAMPADIPPDTALFLQFGFYTDAEGRFARSDYPTDFATQQISPSGPPLALLADGALAIDWFAVLEPAMQGPPLTVDITWHTLAALDTVPDLQLLLNNASGSTIYHQTIDLSPATAPLPQGLFVPQRHQLRVPTDIAAGDYTLLLTDGETDVARPLTIEARARSFSLPANITLLDDAAFAGQIALAGYDLTLDAATLKLTLHWQAITTPAANYRYFVHVLQNGVVVAQQDSVPLDNSYPTDWWASGEVVSNPVAIDIGGLAAGDYDIATGFYNPLTGVRLPLASGADSLHLTAINLGD